MSLQSDCRSTALNIIVGAKLCIKVNKIKFQIFKSHLFMKIIKKLIALMKKQRESLIAEEKF